MIAQNGLRHIALAGLAGACAAFGQAPYDVPIALFAGLIAAFYLFHLRATPRQAAWSGWAFGTGYFMHALQWIVSPFMVDAARHGWMAPFALVFLAAGLALFWALAFWLARRVGGKHSLVLVVTWTAAEMLRAYIFTGFPWAMPAQALVGSIMSAMFATVGPHGVNLWIFALACVPALMFARGGARQYFAATFAAAMGLFVSFPVSYPVSPLTDHTVRLIQPNAAQRDKWDPEQMPVFFDRQLQYTAAPPIEGQPAPDLILWSETAIPWALDLAGTALQEIAAAGGDATVALGAQRRTQTRYFNAMVALGPDGTPTQTYDKHHLVPFGEYMPLGDLLGRIGIYGLAARDGNGYSSGPGAQLMDFGALGKALPLICYEAVFAHDVNAAPERPAFLVQITNDAWFGKGAGPKQHLAQARMRAIEQGLPLARAANTGISAMIDPRGRVIAQLPLNTAGFVDAPLPEPRAATPYSRTGDVPLALLLLAFMIIFTFRVHWTQKSLNH